MQQEGDEKGQRKQATRRPAACLVDLRHRNASSARFVVDGGRGQAESGTSLSAGRRGKTERGTKAVRSEEGKAWKEKKKTVSIQKLIDS